MSRWSAGIAISGLVLLGCASNVQNVWTDPSLSGKRLDLQRVATVALFEEGALRRVAEDELARAIQQGPSDVHAVPSYTLLEGGELEDADRAAGKLKAAGFDGAVVVRVVDVQQRVTSTAPPAYWGGYAGRGWGAVYASPVDMRTDTIVQVQTDIYRIEGKKLLWSATSKAFNPRDVSDLIDDVVKDVGAALREQGLIP